MAARRRWVPIVFGIAILLVFIGIGAIIAVTAWFQQNLEVRTLTSGESEMEFEDIRKKFGGRRPLLEIRDGRPEYTAERAAQPSTARQLETLHVIAWDPDDDQFARVRLPFWLLRLKSEPIRFGAYTSGLDDGGVDLRPEDIEKYGPGIIIDAKSPEGGRVLLWAE